MYEPRKRHRHLDGRNARDSRNITLKMQYSTSEGPYQQKEILTTCDGLLPPLTLPTNADQIHATPLPNSPESLTLPKKNNRTHRGFQKSPNLARDLPPLLGRINGKKIRGKMVHRIPIRVFVIPSPKRLLHTPKTSETESQYIGKKISQPGSSTKD